MTEPTPQQIAASSSSAKAMAEAVLKRQQDASLKSIFNAGQLRVIDKWIATNDPTLDRSEAIRRLVEIGLKAKTK
jgi:hypothetical protein